MSVQLLYYRPWRGKLHSPHWSVWPIARMSLAMMFRRRLFWVLFALSLFMFLLFFFGQYMLFWAESQSSGGSVQLLGRQVTIGELINRLKKELRLNGSADTFRNFFWFQGYMVMIVLALAGSMLVGNDFRLGTLPFYLSKPLAAPHYLAGKALAIAVFINLMTTLPAICLFFQYGFLDTYDYFGRSWHLFWGILGYGLVMTVVLSLVLIATAVAVRKTVPLVLTWTTLFFFFRQLSQALVDRLYFDPRWKLIDIWNSMYVAGSAMLGAPTGPQSRHPQVFEAVLVLTLVSAACLIYLIRRIRAVEVVS